MAVETQSRSPQTIGLDSPSPEMAVFHVALSGANEVGVSGPSETPLASMPRNDGQSTPGFGATRADSVSSGTVANTATARRLRVTSPPSNQNRTSIVTL